jgi:hypothetical protein
MGTKISMATARLDDAAAMAEFLSAIPNGEQLAKVLEAGGPIASRAYDDDTWTARFVASDGTRATCFTVTDITIDQAEMIAAACIGSRDLDLSAFRQAVEEALGPTFDPAE